MMKKILVTGGSGRLGRAVIKDLLEHGYEVANVDVVPPSDDAAPFRTCDLSDYGQAFAVMHGFDAVVHLAANPSPDTDHFSAAQRFHNNALSAFNIFNAAGALGMQRVVWASSITLYGYPWGASKPDYVPFDEQHPPYPQSGYALSKHIGEAMAAQFNRLSGIPIIGLEFTLIAHPEFYEQCPQFWPDPTTRLIELWSYVDYRDAVQAVRKSLEAPVTGAENFLITADDTIMNRPTAGLLAEYFPAVPVQGTLGEYQSLVNCQKAKTMLGYQPQHSWRMYVAAE